MTEPTASATSAPSGKKLLIGSAAALGVAAITVHGRTVHQRYDGPSRWEFLRELKQYAGERLVLGSGDLFTAQACLDMIRYTGVDGVTVARGAIAELKTAGRSGLVAFVTAGDPDRERAAQILAGLSAAGADVTARAGRTR